MDVLGLAAVLFLIACAAAAAVYGCRRGLRRIRDLEGELEAHRSSPLEGELVIVNTARPDDQSIRGFVVRETAAGALVLTGAVYLERNAVRGGREEVIEVPAAGAIVVHNPSSTQIVTDVYRRGEDDDQGAGVLSIAG